MGYIAPQLHLPKNPKYMGLWQNWGGLLTEVGVAVYWSHEGTPIQRNSMFALTYVGI